MTQIFEMIECGAGLTTKFMNEVYLSCWNACLSALLRWMQWKFQDNSFLNFLLNLFFSLRSCDWAKAELLKERQSLTPVDNLQFQFASHLIVRQSRENLSRQNENMQQTPQRKTFDPQLSVTCVCHWSENLHLTSCKRSLSEPWQVVSNTATAATLGFMFHLAFYFFSHQNTSPNSLWPCWVSTRGIWWTKPLWEMKGSFNRA